MANNITNAGHFRPRTGNLGAIKPVSKEALAARRRNDKAARPALEPLPMSPGQRERRERLRQAALERVKRRKARKDAA